MAFLLLVTGQLLEVNENRQAVRTALGAAGQSVTLTSRSQPIDLRAVGILAVADDREQLRIAPSWWA